MISIDAVAMYKILSGEIQVMTPISKILEFQKAGSTTSRYTSMDHKTGFRFPLSQK